LMSTLAAAACMAGKIKRNIPRTTHFKKLGRLGIIFNDFIEFIVDSPFWVNF
jgi:hypothetical protein